MKNGLLTIALWVIAGLAAIGVSWALLIANRPMARYAEETRRQTFEAARARHDGVNSAIADYCLNMTTAADETQKRALARWIVNEAATFEGSLTSEAATCLADARAALH